MPPVRVTPRYYVGMDALLLTLEAVFLSLTLDPAGIRI